MGIVINQQKLINIAYAGSLVHGVVYNKVVIWRTGVSEISFDPDSLQFDNEAYEQIQKFIVRATQSWYIEEIF